jgi:hypothetical protein
MRTRGRDAWIRRRDRSCDDVLASGNHTRVMTFESLALDEHDAIRVDAHADELDVWRTFTPEVLAQLEGALRGAQACRIGDVVSVWMVGSVVDPDELDAMLELATHLATVFEGIDERVDDAVPMTT